MTCPGQPWRSQNLNMNPLSSKPCLSPPCFSDDVVAALSTFHLWGVCVCVSVRPQGLSEASLRPVRRWSLFSFPSGHGRHWDIFELAAALTRAPQSTLPSVTLCPPLRMSRSQARQPRQPDNGPFGGLTRAWASAMGCGRGRHRRSLVAGRGCSQK